MSELEGLLCTYWEQGMEEPPWHVFQESRFTTGGPGGWQREGMHRFSQGDYLTIFDAEGKPLWSGELKRRRMKFFTFKGPWDWDWHPADVEAEEWHGWFRKQPPLEAKLKKATV